MKKFFEKLSKFKFKSGNFADLQQTLVCHKQRTKIYCLKSPPLRHVLVADLQRICSRSARGPPEVRADTSGSKAD